MFRLTYRTNKFSLDKERRERIEELCTRHTYDTDDPLQVPSAGEILDDIVVTLNKMGWFSYYQDYDGYTWLITNCWEYDWVIAFRLE